MYRSGQRTDANSVKDHNHDIVSLHPFSFSSFLSRVIRLIRWFGVVLLTLTEGGRGWTFSQKRRIRSCSSARILVRPPPPFPLPTSSHPPTPHNHLCNWNFLHDIACLYPIYDCVRLCPDTDLLFFTLQFPLYLVTVVIELSYFSLTPFSNQKKNTPK